MAAAAADDLERGGAAGHLIFAIGATGYILMGIFLEERDLVTAFGDTYRGYQKRVSMLVPWVPRT